MKNAVPAYSIQSVDNALQLMVILRRDGVLRVSDAADELEVARSTAHRLISMLRFRGFVEQAQDRTYIPGPALARLVGGPTAESAVAGIARPHLARLAARVNETAMVSVRVGPYVQIIDSVEAKQCLHVGSRVGVRLSARHTAVGKALLAELPFDQVAALYPDLAADEDARTSLQRALSLARRRGFAIVTSEGERGVTALGKSLRDASGTTVAAISIAAPIVRFHHGDIIRLLPELACTVDDIRAEILERSVPSRPRSSRSQ